ncbi:hypothetical protein P9266_06060 [Bacillus subtilis]|uniref:hypothetical protein n=1 Tax=Bacillus TaxID=1386 RepID=UPI0002EFAC6E|nr:MULTISPECIES: hypothetical protein [Terrabacteria group]KFH32880.1 hypothetical protein IA18_08130 [Bacillus subtilis subsp. subtilis]KFH33776.1 hypothetical protein IA17_06595 [Bacillus subtilis subsp. subtilis]MBR0000227.1 hypothetical protein [Bacillus subtilis]MBR0003533.1 hypothetical protein [Bacillus subtilis]MBR0011945.1 hypothetical protein [Bacillus subtilis]
MNESLKLNDIKIINPEPDLDIEASYNFIDFLFNSGPLFAFSKNPSDNSGLKFEIAKKTQPLKGRVMLEFVSSEKEYCVHMCEAEEQEIIEVRHREMERMEATT